MLEVPEKLPKSCRSTCGKPYFHLKQPAQRVLLQAKTEDLHAGNPSETPSWVLISNKLNTEGKQRRNREGE